MQEDLRDSWQRVPRLAAGATPAEQFSIWAMRLWWSAFPELDSAWADLARGFRVCAVPASLESFHRFCSVVHSAAGCGSGIACLHCPRITCVEDRLLEALAAATAPDYTQTEDLLRQIMPASAARIAAPHAARFARELAQAGLPWPALPEAMDVRIRACEQPAATHVSERLH